MTEVGKTNLTNLADLENEVHFVRPRRADGQSPMLQTNSAQICPLPGILKFKWIFDAARMFRLLKFPGKFGAREIHRCRAESGRSTRELHVPTKK